MPRYCSSDQVKSGMPLGGLGAGKIEILPNGTLDFFTFLNNHEKPLSSTEDSPGSGIVGFHFGVVAKHDNCSTGRLLQTVPVGGYQTVERIDFEGAFPRAHLTYHDGALPVEVSLDASSFFIPQDEQRSGLPLASFIFTIKNPMAQPVMVSLVVLARNIVGNWSVSRRNCVNDNDSFTSLDFDTVSPMSCDESAGVLSVVVPKIKDLENTYVGTFNIQQTQFFLRASDIRLAAWDYVQEFSALPNVDTRQPVHSESVQPAGAIAVRTQLKAAEVKQIPVYFCWHFPAGHNGHMYGNWFTTTAETMRFVLESKNSLEKAGSFLGDEVSRTQLPDWLKDALLNNLYPFLSSSLWTRDDKFALLESPEVCPLSGTLDVRFYASIATLLFFPRLELKELTQFANAQRPDGYIPHDLGRSRLDMPSDGTTSLFWKDLNPKFILMAYRDFLLTQDMDFLRLMYPVCKKALAWSLATDKNGDSLPDNEGQDQTFDVWPMYGTSSYVSGIFLAALLAMKQMANHMDDKAFEQSCGELFVKGQENFLKKLWNNNYFICYNNDELKHTACTLFQLTGQWYAHLLGLGYIVDKQMVHKAIRSIFSLNARKSRYGAVNSVFANGQIDTTCSHSGNVWIGINYAFCSLAVYEGFVDEALVLAKRVWESVSLKQRNAWNQPDLLDARSGRYMFGDHYMRPLGIWALALALSKTDTSVAACIESLRKGVDEKH